MEELEKIITAMLDHIDEHKDAYNKPQWSNKLIVRAWLKTHQEQVKKCFISDVVERKAGRITVSFFRKVYKQFIDEQISMTKMLELMTEQAHRPDVCIRCQRPLDGTNYSKDKCNACFTVNA